MNWDFYLNLYRNFWTKRIITVNIAKLLVTKVDLRIVLIPVAVAGITVRFCIYTSISPYADTSAYCCPLAQRVCI